MRTQILLYPVMPLMAPRIYNSYSYMVVEECLRHLLGERLVDYETLGFLSETCHNEIGIVHVVCNGEED